MCAIDAWEERRGTGTGVHVCDRSCRRRRGHFAHESVDHRYFTRVTALEAPLDRSINTFTATTMSTGAKKNPLKFPAGLEMPTPQGNARQSGKGGFKTGVAEEFNRKHVLLLHGFREDGYDSFYKEVATKLEDWGRGLFSGAFTVDVDSTGITYTLRSESERTVINLQGSNSLISSGEEYDKVVLMSKLDTNNYERGIVFEGDDHLICLFKSVLDPLLEQLEEKAETENLDMPQWDVLSNMLRNKNGIWKRNRNPRGEEQYYMRGTSIEKATVYSKLASSDDRHQPLPTDKVTYCYRVLDKNADFNSKEAICPNVAEDKLLRIRMFANKFRVEEDQAVPFNFFDEQGKGEHFILSPDLENGLLDIPLGDTHVVRFKAGEMHSDAKTGVGKDDELLIAFEHHQNIRSEIGNPTGCCYCGDGTIVDADNESQEYRTVHVWEAKIGGCNCRCVDCESCLKCVFCTFSSCIGFCAMAAFGMAS
jgi:hypothetical protein